MPVNKQLLASFGPFLALHFEIQLWWRTHARVHHHWWGGLCLLMHSICTQHISIYYFLWAVIDKNMNKIPASAAKILGNDEKKVLPIATCKKCGKVSGRCVTNLSLPVGSGRNDFIAFNCLFRECKIGTWYVCCCCLKSFPRISKAEEHAKTPQHALKSNQRRERDDHFSRCCHHDSPDNGQLMAAGRRVSQAALIVIDPKTHAEALNPKCEKIN